MKKIILTLTTMLCVSAPIIFAAEIKPPVRIAIIGLSHDHALGFIPRLRDRADAQLVGIVEANPDLIGRYAKEFNLGRNFFFATLNDLLAKTNADAVALFTSAFDHRCQVEVCAKCGVKNVMMEKPLAVNMQQARAIQRSARDAGMQIIVNYETTWYPANQAAYAMVQRHEIGDVWKIVVHDGHRGPKEIGCSTNFLNWLTDPVLNGGGALIDFGCYGADLMTWLMDGQRPNSVFAVTQHLKPEIYPNVDDDATIVLTYPKAQGIIQASWNWPFDRKDMEIYGQSGSILIPHSETLKIHTWKTPELEQTAPALSGSTADPISYLAAVTRGQIKPSGLSSLDLNLIVTEILDAARQSARTGRRIDLRK